VPVSIVGVWKIRVLKLGLAAGLAISFHIMESSEGKGFLAIEGEKFIPSIWRDITDQKQN